jgi:hypothetical protein
MFLDWLQHYWYVPTLFVVFVILFILGYKLYKKLKRYNDESRKFYEDLIEKRKRQEASNDEQHEEYIDPASIQKAEEWLKKNPYDENNFIGSKSYVDELADQSNNWLDRIASKTWSKEVIAAYQFQLEEGIIQKTKDELINEELGPDIIKQIFDECKLPVNFDLPAKDYLLKEWSKLINPNAEPDISIGTWRKQVAERRMDIINNYKDHILANPIEISKNEKQRSFSDSNFSQYEYSLESLEQTLKASFGDIGPSASLDSQISQINQDLEIKEQVETQNAINSLKDKLLAQQQAINELMQTDNNASTRQLRVDNQKNMTALDQLNPQDLVSCTEKLVKIQGNYAKTQQSIRTLNADQANKIVPINKNVEHNSHPLDENKDDRQISKEMHFEKPIE